MRSIRHLVCLLTTIITLGSASTALSHPGSPTLLNRITGQVYDQAHNPVPDVDVELLNDVDSLLTRTRTNGSGAFVFIGVSSGRFRVKVLPFGRGLVGETKDVEVTPLYGGGSDSVYVDFYLSREKNASQVVPRGPGEAIFVQDIPKKAKKLFDSGIRKLEKGQMEGLKDIQGAVDAFHNYYDALSLLGREYIKLRKYSEGYPYLLRAIDINQRSASNYYSLAFAFYELGQIPVAIKAIQACLVMNGGSSEATLLYGTLLRLSNKYKEAEPVLLKALSIYGSANAEVHWQLALLYNRTGSNLKAVEHLEIYSKSISDAAEKKKVEELIAKLKKNKAGETPKKN